MSRPIEKFIFDVYGTLFDVNSLKNECEMMFPGHGEKISTTWRKKQVEYFMLAEIMDRYTPFSVITHQALKYAINESKLKSNEHKEERLLGTYLKLPLFPEVRRVLTEMQKDNLIILSNGTQDMLQPLLTNSNIDSYFSDVYSVHEFKRYKPAPFAYEYVSKQLSVDKRHTLFISSNGWDVSGAKNFGYQTAWINRLNSPLEELQLQPDYVFSDLNGLLRWQN